MSAGPESGSASSERAAGWHCEEEGSFRELLEEAYAVPPATGEKPPGLARQFRWSLFTGRQARNEKLAKLHDPSNDQRRAWMRGVGGDLVIETELRAERVSFVVLGDPGEGDASQFAVVPPLLAACGDADFMVIASDVVYPAGDVNDYRRKFYVPYRDHRHPIFAVPGNHDWDDGGLFGFMYHFAGRDAVAPGVLDAVPAVLQPFWRRPAAVYPETAEMRDARRRDVPQPLQPGSYFALDAGPVLVLGVDLGIRGSVDRDQAAWFRRVAGGDPRPKIVVGGKPIYSGGAYSPPSVEDGGTLDDLVRDPAHRVVAYLSGEVHNYQRYPVEVEPGRWIQYVVCGGGGAFTQGTHTVRRIELKNPSGGEPVVDADVRMYPARGDSLSFFSELYAAKADDLLRGPLGSVLCSRGIKAGEAFRIRPAAAQAIAAGWVGAEPDRDTAEPTASERRAAELIRWLPHGKFSDVYYPYWDWDRPPFFKSFVRIDATEDVIRLRCFAATGCAEHEADPPLEDEAHWTTESGWAGGG